MSRVAGWAAITIAVLALAVSCTSPASDGPMHPATSTQPASPATSGTPSSTPPSTLPGPEGTPTAEPARVLEVGGYPNGIAFAGGSMWIADPAASVVLRLDPETGDVLQRVHAGRSSFLLLSAFGSLWVSNHLPGTVSRIDPASGSVSATITVGSTSASMVAAADGLWATAGGGDVVRIDPATNEVAERIHVGGDVMAIEVAFGSLWATTFEESHVLRFDLATGKRQGAVELADGAGGLAVADGRLWAAASTDPALHAIWPPGRRMTLPLGIGAAPFLLVAVGDTLFAGDRFASRVNEVDARAGTVVAVHEVPSPAIAVTPGPEGVWATCGDTGRVVLLDRVG